MKIDAVIIFATVSGVLLTMAITLSFLPLIAVGLVGVGIVIAGGAKEKRDRQAEIDRLEDWLK